MSYKDKPVGPTYPVVDDPTSLFLTLFTPELLAHIVTETNRFAALCLSFPEQASSPPSWTTEADELKAFFGFVLLMSVVRQPDLLVD